MIKRLLTIFVYSIIICFDLFAGANVVPSIFQKDKKWEVSNFFQGQKDKPFIFIIQDIHCDENVQYKIYEIIKFIKKTYNKDFGVIGIEGNNGEIDTSLLKDLNNNNLKEELSKNLITKGLMTGAEYYDIIYPGHIKLYGVEDIETYNKNLDQIKKGLFDNAEVKKEVNLLKAKNKKSKEIFFEEELIDFEKLQDKYLNKQILFQEFLEKIDKIFKRFPNEMLEYPNINLFLRKEKKLREISFESLQIEMQKILSMAYKHLSKKDKKFIEDFLNKSGFSKDFYNYLIGFLKEKNIVADNSFKQFGLYMDYWVLDKRINKIELLNEFDNFVFAVKQQLAKTVQEKEIVYLDMYTNLFADYIENKVSSKQREKMNFELKNFLEKAKNRYGEINIEILTAHFKVMENFYDTAIKRNEIIVNNLLKVATPISVLVVGGFHTDGIEEFFRAKGNGYLVFTPVVDGNVDSSKQIYLNRMKRETGL